MAWKMTEEQKKGLTPEEIDFINKFMNFKPIGKLSKSSAIPVVDTITETANDAQREVEHVWEKNKEGVNATAGLAARGGLAYVTLGASELVGGGSYLTKQFGGAKETSQYGQLAGTIGGVAGAGAALNELAKQGAISATTANLGTTAASSIISQRAQGKEVDAKRTIASLGGAAINEGVKSNIGSDGMETNFWEDQWNKYGGQVVDSVLGNILGSSQSGDAPKPVATTQQPIVVQAPNGNGGDNQKMMLMIAGGLGLVTLLVLLKK